MSLGFAIGILLATLAPLQAKRLPPFQPGATDITFDVSPPHCDADELKARFRAKENAGPLILIIIMYFVDKCLDIHLYLIVILVGEF